MATDKPAKKKRPRGERTVEIYDQLVQVQEWLTEFKTSAQIRKLGAEQWGLSDRTLDTRIEQARKQLVRDVNAADRQEIAANMMETLKKICQEANDTRQLSNAIGAMRLYGEIAGIAGNKNNN